MFGSMGRRVGGNFCDIDEFTAMWPKFEGHFKRMSYISYENVEEREGSFLESFMTLDALTGKYSLYEQSQYALYLDELRDLERIENVDLPDGKSVLMIRDSFFSPVICFMAPLFGKIDAIGTQEDLEHVSIEQYVRENEYDYIIIEIYPYNIDATNFRFFREES